MKDCLIVLFWIIAIAIAILYATLVSHIGRTSGTHTGIITAVEHNKLVWEKSRAYIKTSAESTQEDQYCVKNQTVYDQLSVASKDKKTVTIHFSHPLVEWSWNCSGEAAIIDSVE